MNIALIKYVLTAARRDKLMMTLLMMTAIGVISSMFLGTAAVIEEQQFSMVFGAGALRFLGVMGVVLFTAFHMRRSFDSKEVEFLLSRPVSRMSFLMSHAFAFVLLSILIGCIMMCAQYVLGNVKIQYLLFWGYSIILEYSVIAVVTLFFSMVLNSAAGAALASLGVYVLGRMSGTLLGIADLPPENVLDQMLSYLMETISILLPRLDMMGQSSWLIYGVDAEQVVHYGRSAQTVSYKMVETFGVLGFISIQSLIFMALVLCAAFHDFTKKQF